MRSLLAEMELFTEVTKPFVLPGDTGFCRGWRLVSMGGTTLGLADTSANEKAYGRPVTATDFTSAFPQDGYLIWSRVD